MHTAIPRGGCKAEDVMTVQLLRDARQRRREIARRVELEVAATGFFGELLEAAVRTQSHMPLAVEVLAPQANRITHHFLIARFIEHLALADRAVCVVAVGKHQSDT